MLKMTLEPSRSGAAALAIAMLLVVSCTGDVSDTPSRTEPPPPPAPPAPVTADEVGDPLLAWAEADAEEGKAPLRVQFTADIEGGTPPLTITWTFGDGSPPSSERNPVHTYETAGMYQVDLDVADSAGDEDSDWLEIEVE